MSWTNLASNMFELDSQKSAFHCFQHFKKISKCLLTNSLTAGLWNEITPYAKRFSDLFQNQSHSPKYHLQMLFNNHVLIPNQHRVKSIQSQADSTVSDQDLEKFRVLKS